MNFLLCRPLALLFVCHASLLACQAQERLTNATTVISHVSVVDIKEGRLVPDQTVVVAGERIAQMGAADKIKFPSNARLVDGTGLFLMPGLFDCHVHLNNPERETRMLVANGIAFVRDMGGETKERMAQRADARRGRYFGMEMACVGTILDGSPPYHAWSRACATPDEGRAAVREMKAAGADQIKVYSLLKPEVHRAICDEAKRLKLKVVGHIPDAIRLEEAAAAGQNEAEHLSGMGGLLGSLLPGFKPTPGEFEGGIWARYPDIDKTELRARLHKLADAGFAQCPTLTLHAGQARIVDAQTRALWKQYATPDDARGWGEIPAQYAAYGRSQAAAFPFLQQTVLEMHRAGTPLLIGTDLANPGILAGFSVHSEMQFWQQAGLAPADVLRSATLVPARFLGVEKRLGSVETGKTASLILTRKNPLENVGNAAEIEAVFARGRFFNRAALDQLLREARDEVATRSADPKRTVTFKLPGVVVARGRYNLFYEQYNDGAEDFVITRDGETYHYKAVRNQPGFGRYPTVFSGTWTSEFRLMSAGVEPLVLLATTEQYTVAGGRLRGNAKRQDSVLSETDVPFSDRAALRSPLLSMNFFLLKQWENLLVGETQNVETTLLGNSDWKPKTERIAITRQKDEAIKLSDSTEVLCRHYTLRLSNDSSVAVEIWVNAEGIPVKQVTVEGNVKRSAVLVTP